MKRSYERTADRAIDEMREIVALMDDQEMLGASNVIVTAENIGLLLGEIETLREVVTVAGVQLEKASASLAGLGDLSEAEVRYAVHACRRALTGMTTEPVRR